MMDDKDKTIFEQFVDTLQESFRSGGKSKDDPMEELDPSRIAGENNEQMYIPDAAAVPLPVVRRRRLPKRANRHAARALERSNRLNEAPAVRKERTPKKKAAKKAKTSKTSGRKAAKRLPVKKTKSSAGRKAVGRKKTAKKVAKKTRSRTSRL